MDEQTYSKTKTSKYKKYFKILLNHFNLTVDDVIYFEHSQAAVDSAKSVGVSSHFYNSDKKDLESLKKFLDINI